MWDKGGEYNNTLFSWLLIVLFKPHFFKICFHIHSCMHPLFLSFRCSFQHAQKNQPYPALPNPHSSRARRKIHRQIEPELIKMCLLKWFTKQTSAGVSGDPKDSVQPCPWMEKPANVRTSFVGCFHSFTSSSFSAFDICLWSLSHILRPLLYLLSEQIGSSATHQSRRSGRPLGRLLLLQAPVHSGLSSSSSRTTGFSADSMGVTLATPSRYFSLMIVPPLHTTAEGIPSPISLWSRLSQPIEQP